MWRGKIMTPSEELKNMPDLPITDGYSHGVPYSTEGRHRQLRLNARRWRDTFSEKFIMHGHSNTAANINFRMDDSYAQ